MADEKGRRKKSPEGRGKKSQDSDDDQAEGSPTTVASTSTRSSKASSSPGTQRASSTSPSKSPMRQVGAAVLEALKRTPSPSQLCCGADVQGSGTKRSSVRRRTPSPSDTSSSSAYSPAPRAIPKKSCLRQRTPSPEQLAAGASPSSSHSPSRKSLPGTPPPREVAVSPEEEPSGSQARSPPRVTFKDVKEGIMPPDDTLFRMFRFRGEVRERISASVLREDELMNPHLPPCPVLPQSMPLQGESSGSTVVVDVHQQPPKEPTSETQRADLAEKEEQMETDEATEKEKE